MRFPRSHPSDCRAARSPLMSGHASLSLDSLGQCVSALSKRFTAAESIQDSAVHCLSHSHRDKNSEIRHRKDAHHLPEDAPKVRVSANMVAMVETQNFDPDLSNAAKRQQGPHVHSEEAQLHLRVRRGAQPQTERREEGSIQGSRDHCAR